MKTDELFAQITDAGKAQAAADHILQAVEQEERIAA